MGGYFSKRRKVSSPRPSWFDQSGYPGSPLVQPAPFYTPQHHLAPSSSSSSPSFDYGLRTPQPHMLNRRYSRIADNYYTLDQVTAALAEAGLESSNLIVGIDFTKSNEWTASTHDQDVFSFYPDERFCNGFEEVLRRYRELVPKLRLSGPTSFAPIIEMAMKIVEESGGQYHVLLIIADGQVTRNPDTPYGKLSPQEQRTVDAIVQASGYPLSIILVGVGDGPWDMMKQFDDNIPARAFDNFQFVNFTEIMSKNVDSMRKQTDFALGALMEIPSQYKATIELNLLGHQTENAPDRKPISPPPHYGSASSGRSFRYRSDSFRHSVNSYSGIETVSQAAPSSSSLYNEKICSICFNNPKDMAFGCGHQCCYNCGVYLESCHICRTPITTRIKLYS